MVEPNSHDVPPSVAAFLEKLSPRVRAAWSHWEWTWHPEWRTPREEFQQDLAKNGIPEWPFLWPLEEAFGGMEVRLAGWDLRFGIWADSPALKKPTFIEKYGKNRFVLIGGWGDNALLSDETGRIYVLDESGVLTLNDSSFESFLEHHAMSPSFEDWSKVEFEVQYTPKGTAALLAEKFSIPAVVEASDECHKWWRNDHFTLFEWGEQDPRGVVWSTNLPDLAKAMDAAIQLCPTLQIKPEPSYKDEHKEVLPVEEIRARAPSVETLSTRPFARRFELIGEPSIYPEKPPSTGDVWISGEGESLRIDVLERREGEVVNYWEVTHKGTHALLISFYGKG